jgi:serine/threonine-protein kinase
VIGDLDRRPRYTIVRELSRSEAPHIVVLARDARGDAVVLKRLRDTCRHREDLALRLRLEAELLGSLGGPHGIVRLAATDDDPFTLVMEYVGGGSLEDRLHDARRLGISIPPARTMAVAAALLEALDYLHGNGVVHRDVKPANVLFTRDGAVRLIDFGVAARSDPTRGGACYGLPADWIEERVGTLPYAAPESVLDPSAGATPAQDVYSAAVVVCEMLTGVPPWHLTSGESPEAFAERVVRAGGAHTSRMSMLLPPAALRLWLAALHPNLAVRPSVRALADQVASLAASR